MNQHDPGISAAPKRHVHFGRGHVLQTYLMVCDSLTFIVLHFGYLWGLEVSKKERKKKWKNEGLSLNKMNMKES